MTITHDFDSSMTQQEFNKQEHITKLIQQAKERDLTYRFVLEEFKRNKWNINLKQAEEMSIIFKVNMVLILLYADDLNILNVDNKTRKALKQSRKHKEDYYN